jgi:RNA polymerase sigma-70 factor (ECF subfamily)
MPAAAVVAPSVTVPALGNDVQEHIGQHLRAAYGDLRQSAVPDRFQDLIARPERAFSVYDASNLIEFRDGILAAVPNLRAFAMSLSGNPDRADDLVQETILRAWSNRDKFQPGTKLSAWLFTIQRNLFHTEYRRRSREVEDGEGTYAAMVRVRPEQLPKMEVQDLTAALRKLQPDQRQALLLVAAEGLSYEEAARVCDIAIGTIKSRVNRARAHIAELMGYTKGDLAADIVMQAAVSGEGTRRIGSSA